MLIQQLVKDNAVDEILIIDNSLKGFSFNSEKIKVHTPEQNMFVNPSWNYGVEHAKNNYVGILNDDLLLSDNICSEILEFLKTSDEIGIVGIESSSVINDRLRDFESYPKCSTNLKFNPIKDIRRDKNFCWGSAMFGKKENFYKIPEEMLIYCGDDYYMLMNAKNGKTNYAFTNTEIKHCHSLSSASPEFSKIRENDKNFYAQLDPEFKKHLQYKKITGWIQQIFSIQNSKDRTHKTITILGFKINLKRKAIKNLRFLVHLHLYYHEQIDYFIDKLKNIHNCDWDLVVTVNKSDDKSSEKILNFKPNAKILQVENVGYDLWPFLTALRSVNIEEYDYVLKLHTKNSHKTRFSIPNFIYKGSFLKGFFWRDELLRALTSTKKQFAKNIKKLTQNPKIGMIASKTFFIKLSDFMKEDTVLLDELKTRLNIKSSYNKFIAGTMFIIKADILKKLVESDLTKEDFIIEQNTYSSGNEGTLVHSIERIFTILTDEAGYRIYAVPNIKMEIYGFFRCLIKNIFSLENSRDKTHKILTILGFKIKFQRKLKSK